MKPFTLVFPAAMLGILLACIAYVASHRVAAIIFNRRRRSAKRRPGLRHERPALECGVSGWTLRGLVVALAAGGTLLFCLAIAAQQAAAGHVLIAREWRIMGSLLGAWAGTTMVVAFWLPFRLVRVEPLALRAGPEELEVRFVDTTRRIPWSEVALRRPSADPQRTWLVAPDLVLLLPGPWRPVDEEPPNALMRLFMAHRAPMRLRDMPLHDDLVEILGEPVIAAVPALTIFHEMKLPLVVLVASMALPVVGSVRMMLAQARGGGADASADRSHP